MESSKTAIPQRMVPTHEHWADFLYFLLDRVQTEGYSPDHACMRRELPLWDFNSEEIEASISLAVERGERTDWETIEKWYKVTK